MMEWGDGTQEPALRPLSGLTTNSSGGYCGRDEVLDVGVEFGYGLPKEFDLRLFDSAS